MLEATIPKMHLNKDPLNLVSSQVFQTLNFQILTRLSYKCVSALAQITLMT